MSGEVVDITTLALKVDATEARLSALELDKFQKSAEGAESAADKFVKTTERQAAVLGKTRVQTMAYDASTMGLSKTQLAQVATSLKAIDAFEKMEAQKAKLVAVGRQLGSILGVSLAGALAAVTALLYKSAQAAGEAEVEALKLAGALRATGSAAGLAVKDIKALADEMARDTFFDDESIMAASSEMLVYKNIQGETFKEGIRLAGDMAALYGGSVRDNVRSIGKALDDPAQGLMMLERSFGKMDERMKDHIKTLVESNRLGEAQAAVLEFLQGKVGGMARALNTGLNAETKNLKTEWDDMLEELGETEAYASTARGAIDLMRQIVKQLREEIAGIKTPLREFSDDITKWMGLTGVFIRYLQDLAAARAKAGAPMLPHTAANLGAPQASADPAAGAASQARNQELEASYAAYKKLGGIMKEHETDLQKEQRVVLEVATAWSRLTGEDLEKAIAQYGNVGNAVNAALAAMPRSKKAQDEYKDALKGANATLDEASGKNANYEQRVKELGIALNAGAIGTMEYAIGWAYLTATQTDAGIALTKLTEDQKKLNDEALVKTHEEMTKVTEALVQNAEQLENEVEKLQMGEAALYRKQAAHLALQLALTDEGEKTAAYVKWMEAQIAAINRSAAAVEKRDAIFAKAKAEQKYWEKVRDLVRDINRDADRFVQLADGFGKVGKSIGDIVLALDDFATVSAESADVFAEKMGEALASADFDAMGEAMKKFTEDGQKNAVKMYGDMAGAAKGFFKEHSAGYRVLDAVEKAFHAAEMAMALQSFATKVAHMLGLTAVKTATTTTNMGLEATETAASVAGSGTRAIASTVAGVAKAFEQMGVWGFVGAAAILAFMAALGANAGGGGGGAPNLSQQRQQSQGTGTILGDDDAKSESLLNALEILRDNSSDELLYQSGMLTALRSIESNMKGLAAAVARNPRLTGADTSGLGLGGGTTLGWGSTRTLADAGIVINAQTVAIARSNISASGYADVETQRSSWFGLSRSTRTDRQTSELSDDMLRYLSRTVDSMARGIAAAARVLLGAQVTANQIEAILNAVSIDLTNISLRDLAGDDIQAALESVLSSIGDAMVEGLFSLEGLSALEDFQRVGEGAFETMIRVASGVERARYTLNQWGIAMIDWRDVADKQGDVTVELIRDSIVLAETQADVVSGIGQLIQGFDGTADEIINLYQRLDEIRVLMRASALDTNMLSQAMITGAGGLSNLTDGLEVYSTRFFSVSEQLAARTNELVNRFEALGLEMPRSQAAFRALIEHYQALGNQTMVGALLSLVPAWQDVQDAATDAAREAHQSWMEIGDLIGQLNGETEAERNARHAGDYTRQFQALNPWASGMNFNQLIAQFQTMFSDEATWAALDDANKDLIRAMLGLAVNIQDNTNSLQSIHPAYFQNPADIVNQNFSDFQRRYGGVISDQPTIAGSISLESQLATEQIAANERRRTELERQFQGYQLPPEYYALATANDLWRARLADLSGDLARVTVLTAQYGEETGSAIFELEKWYEEQQKLIGNNQTALLALQQMYEDRRSEILEESVREITQARDEMRRWRAGLMGADSPLTNQQRLDAAVERYNAARSAAFATGAGSAEFAEYRAGAEAIMRETASFYGRASLESISIFERILQESGLLSGELTNEQAISDPYVDYGDPIPVLQSIQQATTEGTAALRTDVGTMQAEIVNVKEEIAALSIALVEAINALPQKLSDINEVSL